MATRTERFVHLDGTTSYYRIEDRPVDESGQVTRFPRPPAAPVFPPRDTGWWTGDRPPIQEVLRLEDLPVHAVSYTVHGLTVRSLIGCIDTARPYHPVASDGDATYLPVAWEQVSPTNRPKSPTGLSYVEELRARDQELWLQNPSRRELCGCGCEQIADRDVREAGYTRDHRDYDAGQWSCRLPHWNVTGPELWKLMNSGAAND